MDLISEITALGELTKTGVALGKRTDPERRVEIIHLRTAQSAQMRKISKAANDFDFSPYDDAVAEQFRQKLSQLKSVIARHQAMWPVPMIDAASKEYRRSGDNLNREQAAFVAWALKELC